MLPLETSHHSSVLKDGTRLSNPNEDARGNALRKDFMRKHIEIGL